MKLNKTLENIKNGMTIYGEKQFERILNFKVVKSIERNDGYVTINLENGEKINAAYREF